jgi:transposase
MGRSRGGLTTKVHAVVDADGLPIRLVLSKGQAHDGPVGRQLLDHLQAGNILLGDKAYDADGLRGDVAERGAWAHIPPNRTDARRFRSVDGCIANATSSSASSTS